MKLFVLSTRGNVIVSTLTIALLGLIAFSVVNHWRGTNVVNQLINYHLSVVVDHLVNQISGTLSQYRNTFDLVGSNRQLRTGLSAVSMQELNGPEQNEQKKEIDRLLEDLVAASSDIESIVVYDANGRPTFSSEPWAFKYHRSILDFAESSQVKRFAITTSLEGERFIQHDGFLTLDGRVIGILSLRSNLSPLKRTLRSSVGDLASEKAVLVFTDKDEQQVILEGKDNDEVISFYKEIANNASDYGDFSEYTDYRGEAVLTRKHSIEEGRFEVILKIDKKVAFVVLADQGSFSLTSFFIIALLVVIAVFVMSRKLIVPLGGLTRVAQKVSQGDYSDRFEVTSEDEVGRLGMAINSMADELMLSLYTAEVRNSVVLNSLIDAVIIIDTEGRITSYNLATNRLFGCTSTFLLGKNVSELMQGEHAEHHDQYLNNYLQTGNAKVIGKSTEVRAKRLDGSTFYAKLGVTEFDKKGEKHFIGVVSDITESVVHKKQIERLATQNHLVLDSVIEAVIQTDESGRIELYNKATRRLFKCDEHKLIGDCILSLVVVGEEDAEISLLKNELLSGDAEDGNIYEARRHDGSTFKARLGVTEFNFEDERKFIVMISDVTKQVESQQQLEYMALHDPLTGLPARLLLQEKVKSAINRAQRNQTEFALFFLDLNNFKPINDEHGHAIGDLTPVVIANRLLEAVRESDTVARIGGDEFIILADDLGDRGTALELIQKYEKVISEPITSGTKPLVVNVAIGLAIYPEDATEYEYLVSIADSRMYEQKQKRRSSDDGVEQCR